MKAPTVFLSHSKSDRDFIERIATDLRSARINVWYDEWEIPPGESFSRRIFEDGIPSSDLFFVYLTHASAGSYWVTRELDAALIRDAESRGGSLAIFVEPEVVRPNLPLHIRALHSPILNRDVYQRPLSQLISRAWEAHARRTVQNVEQNYKVRVLELEKDKLSLESQIDALRSKGLATVDQTKNHLNAVNFNINGRPYSLYDIA